MSTTTETDEVYKVPVGQTVDVLAIRWDDGWEFDAPTVVLEPVVRYTDRHLESAVEDVLIDLVCDHDFGKPIRKGLHPSEKKEFEWRQWSLDDLRAAAEGREGYWVLRDRARFYEKDGETHFALESDGG